MSIRFFVLIHLLQPLCLETMIGSPQRAMCLPSLDGHVQKDFVEKGEPATMTYIP